MVELLRHRSPGHPVCAQAVKAHDGRAGLPAAPELHHHFAFGRSDRDRLLSRNAYHALLCHSAPQ